MGGGQRFHVNVKLDVVLCSSLIFVYQYTMKMEWSIQWLMNVVNNIRGMDILLLDVFLLDIDGLFNAMIYIVKETRLGVDRVKPWN